MVNWAGYNRKQPKLEASFKRLRGWMKVGVFLAFFVLEVSRSYSQNIRLESEFITGGIVRSIKPGRISIATADGTVLDCKVQNKNEAAMMIGGTPFRAQAKISVTGGLSTQLLEKGMLIAFEGKATESGKTTEVVQKVKLANQDQNIRADFLERPAPGEGGRIAIVGRVMNTTRTKVYLQVPAAKWARQGRISFELTDDAILHVNSDSLNAVRPGDKVRHARIWQFSSGDKVVQEIEIELSAPRTEFTTSYHDRLEQQFRHLSDSPPNEPRQLVSDYFVLYTDLSDRNAQILLAKLNTMYELIAKYFGKRPRAQIECYVVQDLRKWGGVGLHPAAVTKIREGAGVTISASVPGLREAKSVVYSCDNHGVCQHEAVHAFCAMAFGSTGPVWYSEGMAEMGQYWKPNEVAINIDPVVIEFLTSAQNRKKSLTEIVTAEQITGDSWEAYAWRWALCHLLANHPHYRKRFLNLGLAMMLDEKSAVHSFESTFGKVEEQISFEYDQFIEHFGNGYRVDLCAWDWSVVPGTITSSARLKQKIFAAKGWQPTKLKTVHGSSYDYVAMGEWKVSPIGQPTDANGEVDGRGKLQGIIFNDFKLIGPFEMGAKGTFQAASDGQLYLRCADDWTELADNEGEILVHLRLSEK